MNFSGKVLLLFIAITVIGSCRSGKEDFIGEHRESIEKTKTFIEDFKKRNDVLPTSRECHDWIIRQNLDNDAGITILNVRFDEDNQKPIGFDLFDGDEWVYIYNPNSGRVEKKIPFSTYFFSYD